MKSQWLVFVWSAVIVFGSTLFSTAQTIQCPANFVAESTLSVEDKVLIQKKLISMSNQLGVRPLEADGAFDRFTRHAIQAFQLSRSEEPNGCLTIIQADILLDR